MEILLFISILMLLYTFIGYPFLLFILSKVKLVKTPVNHEYKELITVVMVACNESRYISEKIQNIFNFKYPSNLIQLIIVDDCSDDNTVEMIKNFNDSRITLLRHDRRQGKAAGLNLALSHVNTELVLLLDARQKVTLNALSDLSSWFIKTDVAAVSGEVKFLDSSGDSTGMDAYQKYERFIRKHEAQVSSVPGVSGAIYMLRVSQYKEINADTILDDVLIPMTAAKKGGWIGFDERVVAWDIPSDDWAREKKRKSRTLNGNYQLLFRHLHWCLPGGHALWFQYLSHKVLRLAAPIFAFTMIYSSF